MEKQILMNKPIYLKQILVHGCTVSAGWEVHPFFGLVFFRVTILLWFLWCLIEFAVFQRDKLRSINNENYHLGSSLPQFDNYNYMGQVILGFHVHILIG